MYGQLDSTIYIHIYTNIYTHIQHSDYRIDYFGVWVAFWSFEAVAFCKQASLDLQKPTIQTKKN